MMWPLSLALLFATAAPQASPNLDGAYVGRVPQFNLQRYLQTHKVETQNLNDNVCYTMRSYYFQRQDGQAPVLTGVSTCTPAKKLQQKRVSPEPGEMYVPLGLVEINGQKLAK